MSKRIRVVVIAAVSAVVLAGAFVALFLSHRQGEPGPTIVVEPIDVVGRAKKALTITVTAPSGRLASSEVRLVQGKDDKPIATPAPGKGAREQALPLEIDAVALGLKEGPAEIRVTATDDVWRPRSVVTEVTAPFTVDLTAPAVLELLGSTTYLKHAGAGVAIYRTKDAARSGVTVGSAFFPGIAGLAPDPDVHVALFTVPYGEPPASPSLLAEDAAGNARTVPVPVTFLETDFGTDQVKLDEQYIRRKVGELDPEGNATGPVADVLNAFLKINREGRRVSEAAIRQATQAGGASKPLWQGAFRQQPNTKVFARFPQRRTYSWDGRPVDEQWHLGLDLASNARSPVLAAGAGRVVFAGPNVIYGNTVILDHGLGLHTLYAHLSQVAVPVGQDVAAGAELGRSGQTGLAGGDHIHFAMLVDGVYTNPVEWLDAAWIRDRIAKPLVDAGVTLPGITDAAASAAAAPPPDRGRRAHPAKATRRAAAAKPRPARAARHRRR